MPRLKGTVILAAGDDGVCWQNSDEREAREKCNATVETVENLATI